MFSISRFPKLKLGETDQAKNQVKALYALYEKLEPQIIRMFPTATRVLLKAYFWNKKNKNFVLYQYRPETIKNIDSLVGMNKLLVFVYDTNGLIIAVLPFVDFYEDSI